MVDPSSAAEYLSAENPPEKLRRAEIAANQILLAVNPPRISSAAELFRIYWIVIAVHYFVTYFLGIFSQSTFC